MRMLAKDKAVVDGISAWFAATAARPSLQYCRQIDRRCWHMIGAIQVDASAERLTIIGDLQSLRGVRWPVGDGPIGLIGSLERHVLNAASRSAAVRMSFKAWSMENRLYPCRELLGELLLEMGQPVVALKEFETALKQTPNRYRALLGMARAANGTGERQKARDCGLHGCGPETANLTPT